MANGAKKRALWRLHLPACAAALCLGSFWGCVPADGASAPDGTAGETAVSGVVLVHEETVSPNEAYVEDPADAVTYTVEVYQEDGGDVVVEAVSNTPFLEDSSYRVACDAPLSAEDVEVEWITLMGNPEPSKDDQWAVAHVSLSMDGETFDEHNIDFVGGGIDAVEATLSAR